MVVSDGMVENARKLRLPKFGQTRPQKPSSVRDRLSASKPASVATDSWARSRRRRGIAAMWRIATSSLNRPSAPSDTRFGMPGSDAKPSDVMPGDVPEQVELRDAVEPGETGEAVVGERPVDQQVSDLLVVACRRAPTVAVRATSSAAGSGAAAAARRL